MHNLGNRSAESNAGPSGDLTKKACRATNTSAASDNGLRNPDQVVNRKNTDCDDLKSDFYNAGEKIQNVSPIPCEVSAALT